MSSATRRDGADARARSLSDGAVLVEGESVIEVSIEVVPSDQKGRWHLRIEQPGCTTVEAEGVASDRRSFGVRRDLPARLQAHLEDGSSFRHRWKPGEAGSESGELRVVLSRLGAIRGVVQHGGEPTSGVKVRVVPAEQVRATWTGARGSEVGAAISDAEGRFELKGLEGDADYAVEATDWRYLRAFVGPLRVGPGEVSDVAIELARGGHLRGRIVDASDVPFGRIDLHVFDEVRGSNVTRLESVAQTTTDREGQFVTPALSAAPRKLVKALVRRGATYYLVQRLVDGPAEGSMTELGTLRASSDRVRVRLQSAGDATQWTLTLGALGDGSESNPNAAVAELTFPESGDITVHGLPRGLVQYVVAPRGGGAGASGEFVASGSDEIVVEVPKSREGGGTGVADGRLAVHAECSSSETVDVTILRDGAIVERSSSNQRVGPRTSSFTVRAGRYTVLCASGRLVEQSDIEVVPGTETVVRLAPRNEGLVAKLIVRRHGDPAAGAEVVVRGFTASASGRVGLDPDVRTSADGSASVQGIPVGVPGVRVAVTWEGTGRSVFVPVEEFAAFTIDL